MNRAGWYLRLGVANSERKRFSIFIPKGKGDKGGWVIMAEKLQQMEGVFGRKPNKQEARVVGKPVVEIVCGSVEGTKLEGYKFCQGEG